jgi:hypothetical protein
MSHAKLRVGCAATAVVLAAALAQGLASATITVNAGEDLQAALNQAQPGDEIRLEAGATFEGNFELPEKSGDNAFITIRSATGDGSLPGSSGRIGPEHADLLPTIKSPNGNPALRTAPGADRWRILAVQFQGSPNTSDVIRLGDGSAAQRGYDGVPENLILDRVLVRGSPTQPQKRGIALNSGATIIRNSYIADIKAAGQDTQAIAGWNGPGPYLIENNYLEAAGENVLFGGAEPSIGGLVPSDIVIRRNHLTKPLSWRNSSWTVKNLLELKNARRVLIEGNILEHNWAAAQQGYAILFTVRSSGPRSPWSTIEDVRFQHNLVRHVASAINILGYDTNNPSQQARNILIRNNLFQDVDKTAWGGNGTFLQVGDEPANVIVDHNTILQSGNAVTAYGGTKSSPRQIHGFRFTNNIAFHNQYGIFGAGHGVGNGAIARYFPGSVITGNVLAGGKSSQYPAGNLFPTVDELLSQFVNYEAGDFRLKSESGLRAAATSGGAPGVDFNELNDALNRNNR